MYAPFIVSRYRVLKEKVLPSASLYCIVTYSSKNVKNLSFLLISVSGWVGFMSQLLGVLHCVIEAV
jgi:hypothetical protein